MTQPASIRYTLDTTELAVTYDVASDFQFEHGKGLVAGLSLKPGDKVLDVGSGTGRLGVYVAGIVGPSGTVSGIDPLPLRVELANAKGIANFTSRVGSAEDLSAFADASFDAVYLNSVFHWVGDKPRALKEALRVLKPNGRLALNTQDPDHPHQSRQHTQAAFALAGLKSKETVATEPARGVNSDDLAALLSQAGFAEVAVELRTFVDYHADVDALIAWSASSSFGNFLSDVPEQSRDALRSALATSLQPVTSSRGIRLERYLNFAFAKRPQ